MSALFSTNHRNRGRASLRMLGIAMIVFMLLSVLTPLLQPAGAEEIVDSQISDAVLDEQTEDPNADPEGDGEGTIESQLQIQEDVVPEEDLDGIYVDPVEPVGFYVNKHDCPSDFGHDIYQLAANCSEPTYAAEFQVYGPNYTQFFSGDFGDDGLESGVYSISESIPNGYAEPIVFCKLSDFLGNDNGMAEVVTYDGYYEVQIDPGLTLYCDWFNHPLEPVGGGTVIINKHFCDAGFDAYNASIYDMGPYCQSQEAGVSFELFANGTSYGTQVTGGQALTGLVQFDNVPGVPFSIYEGGMDGYGEPIIYCKLTDAAGADTGFQQFPVGFDNAYYIESDLSYGEVLYCDWFNVLDHDGGSVTVIKYECPDVLSHEATFGDYQYECWQPQADVDFKLDGASTGNPGNYLTDAEGKVTWGEREADHFYLTETELEGYGTPVVYCTTYVLGDNMTTLEYVPFSVSADGQIEFDLDENQHIICYWFNMPEHDDNGSVTVVKYECHEVLDWEASYELYQQTCTQPQADVDFKLDGASTGNPGNYLTDANGRVVWDDREADTYYLTETVPAGYGRPVVYCNISTPGDGQVPSYFGYAVSDEGRIEFDLDEGEHIICYWFNVPGDGGGIIVIKHTCPQIKTIVELGYEDYLEACPERTDGIPYSLELLGNDYLEWSTTGDFDAGSAHFESLGSGEYKLTEDKPEGYGKPVIFCQRYVEEGGGVTEYTEFTADEFDAIGFELGEYEGIVCHWFNFPDHDDSTVSVHKFICPEHASLDADQDYYQEKCTVAHEGVTFNLNGESTGDQGSEVTDGDGTVSWDGLDTDLYTLDEEIPAGYGEPIVFCGFTAYHNGAIYDGFPVMVDEVYDGAVELDIEIPNSSYFCWYYNIPNDDTSITIYKWLCPENFDLYDDAGATCTEPLNGVTFTADGPDGYQSQSNTGDAIPYAVQFGGLEEGHYEIVEILPEGIEYGFVGSCWGNSNPAPAVYPLYHTQWDGAFNIELTKGDQVVCHWYNVPEHHEDDGKLTVIKYLCGGYVVSDLNCEIYRDGQAFRLSPASGEGDAIEFETGVNGEKTLALPAGTWNLDEIGGDWCKATSYDLNGYGQIVTSEGHESVVHIYNCSPPSKTPPVKQPPTKQGPPIKEFPNTGSGTMAMASGLTGSDLAGQGLILLLVAQGLVLIALRRGGPFRFATRRTS